MSKINILYLITGLDSGGAERVVLDLATHLDDKRFSVYVAGLSEADELVYKFEEGGIPTTTYNVKRNPGSLLRAIFKLYRFIKRHHIELLHVHMVHPMFVSGILKILMPRLKIVFTPHTDEIEGKARELFLWLTRWLRDADTIFSKGVTRAFFVKNIHIIGNGIETNMYDLAIPKFEKFTFIAVGRLEVIKNHQLLIKIAKNLQKKYDFQILIVGKGILEEQLIEQISNSNLRNTVKLLGHRNDVPQLCNQSHVYLMPSLWEGLPISLLEAGASGLPPIINPVGSIPKVVDETNGYPVSLEQFQEAMESALNDPETAKKKGLLLKQKIQAEYDVKEVICKYEKLYLSLLVLH